MAKFKDRNGRTYSITLTDTILAKVRRLIGVDLQIREDVRSLADDFEGPVNTLFLCCQGQAAEYGLSAAEFGEALADPRGDVFDAAITALLKECRKVASKRRR